MTLWIVLTVMISAAAAALAVALTRRQETRRDRPGEAAALRVELADLESQATAGALPAATAEALKAETIRRFLGSGASAPSPKPPLGRKTQMAVAVALAAVVALGASLLYAKLGRPDLAAAHPAAPAETGGEAAQVAGLLPQLEAKVRANPDDPQGLRLLGGAYMDVERYKDAADVFARLAVLDPQDAEIHAAQGEALTRAGGGSVTPQAAAAFRAAIAINSTDPRARYFLALLKDQQGDHAGAIDDWIALIRSAPPGAPWVGQVRDFARQVAAQNGIDLQGRLPADSSASASAGAAGQQAMIAGMVDRLDARLKANPHDEQGWVMLMKARIVLGQPDAASQALQRGRAAFEGAPQAQHQLTEAARQLGVPGA
ncbi:MAG TPA: c-type cytochrome biogenesis protein CcmI [Caulobacteraceae bacterium]|jgi:cytochrome c-type biogenesis protein CcmH|nr:c-type cytochrome biogenesis protein CcmI [Caulobacteraceae bacterium]